MKIAARWIGRDDDRRSFRQRLMLLRSAPPPRALSSARGPMRRAQLERVALERGEQGRRTSVAPAIGGGLKRGFDIAGALSGLMLLAPLMLMLAALVKSADGGSVFFRHKRIGRNGLVFDCLKFRTMVANGDDVLAVYLAQNPKARREWHETRKLKDDPRVTRVGAVMRKLSLDELPQIVNILLGDMSIVGPRPVVRKELDMYGSAARYYLSSRPGLTGLWQISGRNDVSYDQRVEFDTHYVKNWSLAADIHIIIKTLPAVCNQRGSY